MPLSDGLVGCASWWDTVRVAGEETVAHWSAWSRAPAGGRAAGSLEVV
jgi:hypothetical protein